MQDYFLTEHIHRLAIYVVANPHYEEVILNQEANNPLSSFLFDPISHAYKYYQWKVYCIRYQWSPEQIHYLEERHRQKIVEAIPRAALLLIDEDLHFLRNQLLANTGSKDGIQAIRRWIIDHSHSLKHITQVMEEVSLGRDYPFCLHTLYVVNDCLHNLRHCTVGGPYSTLLPGLIHTPMEKEIACDAWRDCVAAILYQASITSSSQEQMDRLHRLIEGWRSKELALPGQIRYWQEVMLTGRRPVSRDMSLVSPYLDPELMGYTPPPPPPPPIPFHTMPYDMGVNRPLSVMPTPPIPLPTIGVISSIPPPPTMTTATTYSLPLPLLLAPKADEISVGKLVQLSRASQRSAYAPLPPPDMLAGSAVAAAHIEPARLEVRLNEFYRRLDSLLSRD
eukprot:gene4792-5253_t